ncbi:S8 family serine peptidase [Streptacidiphilus jiangxiensis]|uniref:S8 family serine peptidase n=1 Tax=Streptacidiphilus jiangxiensis TaxID=235985 RepID=UPI000693A693|nr:S8 family serine peptidase [Streptacidiphilus jiangxiensis]
MHRVTLITGDTVTVTALADGRSVATVHQVQGSTGGVLTQTVGKDLYVYPAEALPYVASGALDKRLFDVSLLIADGYDDAHTAQLPLIVQYAKATGAAARAARAVAPAGMSLARPLTAINGAAVTAARSGGARLWQSLTQPATAAATGARFGGGIDRVWLDGKVKATLAQSTAQIGAPDAWNAGVTGKGVDVAVLDTGIDAGHPDLSTQIAASQSFVPGEDTTDHYGHGTHVSSTIAGTGAASNGVEKGVAPGAHLLVGKVLSDQGEGDESWIIAGMQWAAQTEHARVISMSLGSPEASDGTDPMSQAVNDLSASTGALFVIAAGNSGGPGVSSPGAATDALTVGAVDSNDQLAWFSSTGPRTIDGGLKPEITAPGVDILAARSQYDSEGSGSYITMSGTSMATPHVAGTAALLAEEHPDWTGQQLKDALVSTSKETPDIPVVDGGAGRVDAHAAVLGSIDASAEAWSGYYPWPHTGDKSTTKTVTYTNTGASDVTLSLATKATGPDGNPAPAGVFTLSAQSVTVPAHGTAQVSVTGDPNAAAYGVTDGQVQATDATGAVVAHTLIGVEREDERYNLTVKATDRSGAPLSGTAVLYRTGDPYPNPITIPASGTLTMRLPKGEYSLLMYADLPGATAGDDLGLGVLSVPQIDLDANRTAALDARTARQVAAVTPQTSADRELRVEWNRATPGGGLLNENFLVPIQYTSVWAQPTAPVTDGSFHFDTRWSKGAPPVTLTATEPRFPSESFPDAVVEPGSTLLPAGSRRLKVAYLGNGLAADYTGRNVKGMAVVVQHLTGASFDQTAAYATAQAQAAAAAGAKLLIVVNDSYGRLAQWYGAADFTTNSPIEVVGVRHDEGSALVSATLRGGVQLDTVSTPNTPYVYDLVERKDGNIPNQDLTYRPKLTDLARVDSRFAGSATAPGYEGRYDMQNFDQFGVGFDMVQQLGTVRTDYVTPGAGGFKWYDEAGITNVVNERALITDYRKGTRSTVNWLTPVVHPRLNNAGSLPFRGGDWFSLNIPGYGDGNAGHSGFDYGLWSGTPDKMLETVTLYQGSTKIGSTIYQQLNVQAPSQATLPYRLVAATSQNGVFPTSTATRTEWGFTSGTNTDGAWIPLIQLDYGVATDLNGDAARHSTLTLTASQLPGATGAGTITGATLQVSFDDGSTWHTVSLKGGHGSWSTQITAPSWARYVSLRATSHDSAHNTVTQTVLRAYGVK